MTDLTKPHQFEMFVSHVIDKINERRKNSKFMLILKCLVMLTSIAVSIYMLYYFIKLTNPDTVTDTFKFENTLKFKYIRSPNKKEDVMKIVYDLYRTDKWIKKYDTKMLLKRINESNFAYLLYGAPGTGKTIFIKEVAYKLDMILREKVFKEKDINTYNKILDEINVEPSNICGDESVMYAIYKNDLNENENLIKNLENISNQVRFISITPSSIYDKYVGESSKNVRRLFNALYSTGDKITIAMFDEGDALFRNRKLNLMQNGQADVNVKSEFLTNLSQQLISPKSVYTFVTTNHIYNIDDAFLRRLGHKVEFKMPNKDERREFITEVLGELDITLDYAASDLLARITEGCSYSFITKKIKSCLKFEEDKAESATFE